MGENNFILIPRADIGYIYNYVQNVVPFVYDESLDMWVLLKKLITYCNEMGERSNELNHLMKKLVDYLNDELERQRQYINNFLTALYSEWVQYKKELEERYDNFTKEIDRLFEEYKTKILEEYNKEITNIRNKNEELYQALVTLVNNKINELNSYVNKLEADMNNREEEYERVINELVRSYSEEFNKYQEEIQEKQEEYNKLLQAEIDSNTTDLNTKIETIKNEYNTKLNETSTRILEEIRSKSQEIEESLNEINLEPLVKKKLVEMNQNNELTETLDNIFGTIIYLYSLNGNLEKIDNPTPLYDYNTENDILTDLTTLEQVPINMNSLYIYQGRVFYGYHKEVQNDVSFNPNLGSYSTFMCLGSTIDKRYYYFSAGGSTDLTEFDSIDKTFRTIKNISLLAYGTTIKGNTLFVTNDRKIMYYITSSNRLAKCSLDSPSIYETIYNNAVNQLYVVGENVYLTYNNYCYKIPLNDIDNATNYSGVAYQGNMVYYSLVVPCTNPDFIFFAGRGWSTANSDNFSFTGLNINTKNTYAICSAQLRPTQVTDKLNYWQILEVGTNYFIVYAECSGAKHRTIAKMVYEPDNMSFGTGSYEWQYHIENTSGATPLIIYFNGLVYVMSNIDGKFGFRQIDYTGNIISDGDTIVTDIPYKNVSQSYLKTLFFKDYFMSYSGDIMFTYSLPNIVEYLHEIAYERVSDNG